MQSGGAGISIFSRSGFRAARFGRRTQNACPDQDGKSPLFFGQPYQITLGKLAFAVIDTANADDRGIWYPEEYQSQLTSVVKNMDRSKPTFVLTHRPFWGIKVAKDPKTLKDTPLVINETLQSALSGTSGKAFPSNVALVVSGHMHRFQAMGFSGGPPPQIIVGTGGVGLSKTFPKQRDRTRSRSPLLAPLLLEWASASSDCCASTWVRAGPGLPSCRTSKIIPWPNARLPGRRLIQPGRCAR